MPASRCVMCNVNFELDEYTHCPICEDSDGLDRCSNVEADDPDEVNVLVQIARFEREYGPADVEEFELAEAAGTLPSRVIESEYAE